MYAYVGSRTTKERHARGEGISVFNVDSGTGELKLLQVVKELVNPSYLVMNKERTHLYSVHGDLDYATAFQVNSNTGEITKLNSQTTHGKNPVHLALDPTEQFLIVSNHLGGSLAVLPINEKGELEPTSQLLELDGAIGPHRVEQTQVKPHFNGFDPSGKFVVVPDKGLDRVSSIGFANGKLETKAIKHTTTREAAGPRHHVFHPHLSVTYVVNELDSTVTVYEFNANDGDLRSLQRVSTLPDFFTGNSRAAAICISPDGSYLYASNRGHDSIAIFSIDQKTGLIQFKGTDKTLGKTPRFITLNPNGTLLYALNEDSDSITTFAIDSKTGHLTHRAQDVKCGSPVCLIFS